MSDLVLVINAGSSSLRFSLFRLEDEGGPVRLAGGQVEGIGGEPRFAARCAEGSAPDHVVCQPCDDHRRAILRVRDWIDAYLGGRPIAVIGHRVVHGGTDYREPALIDGRVLADLRSLTPLAPLHQPHNLAAIDAMAETYAGVPQVACFDTGFHRSQPRVADCFALPRAYYDEGIRRYGFHGLSYEYIARALADRAPTLASGRVVVAHLGNGASCCALKNGKSVASTMGFTALDGLPMGTRCGQIDPGVILHLLEGKGMTSADITDLLYRNAGLKGLSGISNDVRDLLRSDAPAAADAIAYFNYRLRREIAGLAAAMEGIDGLVFTAGIGEHAASVRRDVCEGLAWLGLRLDTAANRRHGPIISSATSLIEVHVMPTDEESMIASHAASLYRAQTV